MEFQTHASKIIYFHFRDFNKIFIEVIVMSTFSNFVFLCYKQYINSNSKQSLYLYIRPLLYLQYFLLSF